jgi:hypothetical protein
VNNVGGLVGLNSGSITNSAAHGSVNGENNVGGLVGVNEGIITSVNSQVDISGNTLVGGLVGFNSGNIQNAEAAGRVRSAGDNSGGLVGLNAGSIINSISSGDISGMNVVGGLVGSNSGGNISNSTASEQVTGVGDKVGGLVGLNTSASTIHNSNSQSNVFTSGDDVGGLVGSNFGEIADSVSEGNVQGNNYVGGLVGIQDYSFPDIPSSIDNSFSWGTIQGQNGVGGLVGLNNGTISYSGSKASTSGVDDVGGLAGINGYVILHSASSVGVVSGRHNVGGLVGRNVWQINNSVSFGEVVGGVGATDDSLYWNVGTLVGSNDGAHGYPQVSNSGDSVLDLTSETVDLFGDETSRSRLIGNNYCFLFCTEGNAGIIGVTERPGADYTGLELLNSGLETPVWNVNTFINSGKPYLLTLSRQNFYIDLTPPPSHLRRFAAGSEVTRVEDTTSRKIRDALSGKQVALSPDDFSSLGITGVTTANLPILLKLLKDKGITNIDPVLIAKQIEIANVLLAKQKKAKQSRKVKNAGFESSSWTSFIPSLLLG